MGQKVGVIGKKKLILGIIKKQTTRIRNYSSQYFQQNFDYTHTLKVDLS